MCGLIPELDSSIGNGTEGFENGNYPADINQFTYERTVYIVL